MYPQHLPYYKRDFEQFPWKMFQTEHFIFHVCAESLAEKEIQSIIAIQEESYQKVETFLGFKNTKKIEYFFYSTPEEKKRLMGDEYYGQAIYNEFRIHVLYNEIDRVIGPHEITHLLSLPWGLSIGFFQEGLAEYLTGHDWYKRSHKDMVRAYGIEKLHSLSFFMNHYAWIDIPDEAMSVAYSHAGAYAAFLIETFSKTQYESVYRALHRENSVEENIKICENVFKTSLEEIDAQWRDWLFKKTTN